MPTGPPPLPPPVRYPADLNHASRPLWRLALGGLAVGGGVLVAGFGISALGVNGQCSQIPSVGELCNGYSTVGVGGGLMGAGLTLAAGGLVLLAVPGRQARVVVGFLPGNGSATGSAK